MSGGLSQRRWPWRKEEKEAPAVGVLGFQRYSYCERLGASPLSLSLALSTTLASARALVELGLYILASCCLG